MATTKSTRLTNREDNAQQADARLVEGKVRITTDTEALATGELDAADIILYDMIVPSNAIHSSVDIYNDDLDSNGSPTLVLDIGLAAAEQFTSTTSSTDTVHAKDSILDADALVDGATDAQAATTDWTRMTPDSATFGPEDANKPYWEILGYDNDPRTNFRVAITVQAGAATAAAGDLSLRVTYLTD
jgi:hypothetical protein